MLLVECLALLILLQCCYELYGAEMASLLLTTLSRVFILFGQSYGFTCGMDDLLMRVCEFRFFWL